MFRLTLFAATLTALPLAAQDAEVGSAGPKDTRDASYLQSIEDTDLLNADGETIGEVEEILVNGEGVPAGVRVELDQRWFNLSDNDVAIPMNALHWENGQYVSKMTSEQLEQLRPWDE